MFNSNTNQLTTDWAAVEERKPKRLAWYAVISSGLKYVISELLSFRLAENRKASATAQTMLLERMLNLRFYSESAWSSNAFPTAGDKIYIENVSSIVTSNFIYSDAEQQLPRYIYSDAESQPPFYIYSHADYLGQCDFIVKVPSTLVYDEAELRAEVDTYNAAGFRYIVETYTI